ncbi:MAG: hypothetical protein ACU0GG_11660 [Paracoccaceae bacterium]
MASVDASAGGHTPLGAGGIIGDSFSIFFSKIGKVLMLAFLPTLVGLVISGALAGWGVTLGYEDPTFTGGGGDVAGFVLSIIVSMGFYGLTIALLVLLAYDAKQGRSRPLGEYFAPALKSIVPIVVLALVVGILAAIGFVALIIPGLWVYAVFAVVYPAIAIEGVGFGGLRRSAALTKGYRWPIVGVIIVIGICTFVLNFAAGFGGAMLFGIVGNGSIIMSVLITSVIYAISYGLSAISIALIYARLREIKEGVSVSDLAAVFD